jgi:hypothetical protein
MSGGRVRARARKVRVGMEACILLTRALKGRVSKIFFLIIKIGSQGHLLVKRGPGGPT